MAGDGDENFEDIFDMMLSSWRSEAPGPGADEAAAAAAAAGDGPGAKRRRVLEGGEISDEESRRELEEAAECTREFEDAEEALAQDDAEEAESRRRRSADAGPLARAPRDRSPGSPERPPPSRVAAAFGLLDVPLTATAKEVERQYRLLARRHHPDKAPQHFRAQAAQRFRELQEAKAAALSWLRRRRFEDSDGDGSAECSDDPEGDDDGGVFDSTRAGAGSDTPSEEEGPGPALARGGGAAAASDGEGSSSSSGRSEASAPRAWMRAACAGGLRTGGDAVAQAAALSRFLAAPAECRQQACPECLQRPAARRGGPCRACRARLGALQSRLGRPR